MLVCAAAPGAFTLSVSSWRLDRGVAKHNFWPPDARNQGFAKKALSYKRKMSCCNDRSKHFRKILPE